jgi:hypothetical protein
MQLSRNRVISVLAATLAAVALGAAPALAGENDDGGYSPAGVLNRRRQRTATAGAERAALRRVATLVARETAPDDAFGTVGREVGEGSAWTPRTWVATTLVAQGASPSAVFDAMTGEVAALLDASAASLAARTTMYLPCSPSAVPTTCGSASASRSPART